MLRIVTIAACCFMAIPAAAQTLPPPALLGQIVVPSGLSINGVAFGGISDLAFDNETGRYFAISDDRVEKGPARYYELELGLTEGVATLNIAAMHELKDETGAAFAPKGIDAEGIALDRKDGKLAYFQPIQDLATGQTAGFEALLRLNHPDKGLLSPAAIVSLAEENGTIQRIGNLILDQSIANLARLSRLPGMDQTYVAVNFSPLQFEPGLPTRIAGVLHRHGILPARLVIEITEAVIMKDDPQIRAILNAIHQLGCRIALDDFGTGYSSLSYLSRFPVDIVKIDQSFTRSICDDTVDIRQRSRMLVEGIAAISHKMNCTVIAEGVETEEQKDLLTDMGADFGQGYYFARPQPVQRLIAAFDATSGQSRFAARQA